MNSSEQADIFLETIKTLKNTGALEHVIVIGSWAEYVYQEANVLNLTASLKTHDIDLLVPNINYPREKINLPTELEKQGFELRQTPDGFMKFDKNGIVDLEFLVREIGSGQAAPYKVNSLGVTAQGLRNMEILTKNTLAADVKGLEIIVPRPEAYVLHKLAINKNRLPDYKKEKDIESAKNVLKAIEKSPQGNCHLQKIYDGLTKKQKSLIQDTCERNAINLPVQREIKKQLPAKER